MQDDEAVQVFGQEHEIMAGSKENYLLNFDEHSHENQNQNKISGGTFELASKKATCNFMRTDGKEALVEAYLGLYRINEFGQIKKEKQEQIHYDINFRPTKKGQMKLQLSQDKNYILLPYNLNQKQQMTKNKIIDKMFIKQTLKYDCLVWDSHTLKSKKLHAELKKSLRELPYGKLIEMNYVGCNEHFMVLIKRYQNQLTLKKSKTYLNWIIYSSKTGQIELDITNLNIKQESETTTEDHFYRLVGILTKSHATKFGLRKFEKALQETDLTETESFRQNQTLQEGMIDQHKQLDDDENDNRSDHLNSSEGNLKTDRSVEEETKDIIRSSLVDNKNYIDLEITLIFASLEIDKIKQKLDFSLNSSRIVGNDKSFIKEKDEKDEKNNQIMCWTRINVFLSDIKLNARDIPHYINYKAKSGFENFHVGCPNFKTLPKQWFYTAKGEERNWEGEILISSNRRFDQFGFINRQQNLYLAYEFTKQFESQAYMGSQILPKKEISEVQHGRNQYTKEHLYLIIRIKSEDTTTYCFEENNKKTKIKFTNDHPYATQDVIHQGCTKHNHGKAASTENEYVFQSTSLSRDDQEILFKSNTIIQGEKGNSINSKLRTTISQHSQYMYPVFCYNIGMFKLVIQNTLGDGIMYIHELQNNEAFISFVDFVQFKDIGFQPLDIQIEGNSHFAFVTYDRIFCNYSVQLLFVDTNKTEPSFKLFKSTLKVLSRCISNDEDVVIKTIMYSTQKGAHDSYQIKLLIQYPDHFFNGNMVDIDPELIQMIDNNHHQVQGEQENEDDANQDGDSGIAEKHTMVPFLLDKEKGLIFYVKTYAGMCRIYEIKPTSDEEHLMVFELKSNYCYGFSKNNQNYLFLDENKVTQILQKQNETPMLVEVSERKMKDKDSLNFQKDPQALIILKEKYIISRSKIFYLFEGQPLTTGIMDMEELASPRYDDPLPVIPIAIPIKLNKGPYLWEETLEFGIVYKDEKKFIYNLQIKKLPDAKRQKIITDFTKQVDLATFLTQDERKEEEDEAQGQILIKLRNRFIIYDASCEFVNELQFYESNKQRRQQKPEEVLELKEKKNDDDEDSKGYEEDVKYIEEGQYPKEQVSKLRLHQISEDNKQYLFYKEVPKFQLQFPSQISGEVSPNKSSQKMKKQSFDFGQISPSSTNKENQCSEHETMEAQSMVVFKLESTGEFNRKKMLLGNTEDRQMFKLDFEFNLLEDNIMKIEQEDQQIDVSIMNDGCIHVIKTFWKDQKISDCNSKEQQMLIIKGYFITRCGQSLNKSQAKQGITQMKYEISETVCFDKKSKDKAEKKIQKLIDMQQNLKKNEERAQSDLPSNFKDDTKQKQIVSKIRSLEQKKKNIVKAKIFGDYLIVRCAQQILFTKIDKFQEHEQKKSQCEFTQVNCEYDEDFEIFDILSTSAVNEFQIIARDEDKGVLIMQSWNFEMNIETSMMQYPIVGDQSPEFHVVKGMNMKRNYFQDSNYIFDLEFNIPLQSVQNACSSNVIQNSYSNQRKIYKDSSISLCLDEITFKNLSSSRMDLFFWANIVDLGEQTDTIIENIDLVKFNAVFDELSMFHYFAGNPEVIEAVCKKYKRQKEHNQLNADEILMPLLILHPDKDGQTALDRAMSMHRPKTFKFMIDLLSEVTQNFCLTKLMLDIIPIMVQPGTFCYHSFFDQASFQPLIMQEPMIIQWPDDITEFIFASHTTLISEKQVVNEIFGKDALSKEQIEDLNKISKDEGQMDMSKLRSTELKKIETKQTNWSRVKLEALDFDWIFQEGNAKTFLEVLTQLESSSIYSRVSIQILIQMLWKVYQPLILRKVVYPYLFYVISFITLQQYVDFNFDSDAGQNASQILFYIQICSISLVYGYFIKFEVLQFIEDPQGYMWDIVNIQDMLQYSLNLIIIVMFIYDFIQGQNMLSNHYQKGAFALACFLMWMKIYYLMRVFQDTAHFITLIYRVVIDIQTFTIMLLIVLAAFANFFYVIDEGDDAAQYVGRYVKNRLVDSFIEMYFVSLGNYNKGNYSNGMNSIIIWIGFLIATFIVSVVFMNLLISIIGNTLSDVQAIQQESQYQEQAEMIFEYISILNLEDEFKSKKYIIYVSKDQNDSDVKDNISTLLNDFKQQLFRKNEIDEANNAKKNDNIEKSNRIVLKNLNSIKTQLNNQQSEIKKMQKVCEISDYMV